MAHCSDAEGSAGEALQGTKQVNIFQKFEQLQERL